MADSHSAGFSNGISSSSSSSTSSSTSNPGAASSLSSSSTSAAPSSTSSSTNAPSSLSNSASSLSSSASSSSSNSTTATEDEHKESRAHASSSAAAVSSSSSSAPPASAMEVDSGAGAAAVVPAAAASPAAASVNGDHASFLRTQLKCIEVEAKKSAESVLRHLSKMLAALKKNPNLLATRKFRADNIAVKKFVMDVSGALAIAKFVGFEVQELTEKKTPYLLIDEQKIAQADTQSRLHEAIEAVNAAVAVYDAPPGAAAAAAAATPVAKKLCEGGCGFFGSPDTEGFCSLCFKKKFLGGGGALSPAKPAAAPSSFVTPPKGQGSVPAASAAHIPSLGGSLSLGAGGSGPAESKCMKHCGRIATQGCKGFCKQCFDTITAQGQKPPPKRWKCLFDGAIVKLRAVHRFNLGKKPVQTERNRCWVCRKKIGITGFECRCRYVFCGQHRYMEQHDCSYDIKSLHRKKLKKENEKIRAAKIVKL